MLTIEDIRNPDRKSGFDHVSSASGENDRAVGRIRWRAAAGGDRSSGGSDHTWRGPTRWLPEEAARDYCFFINGGRAPVPNTLKSVGHTARTPSNPSEDLATALARVRELRGEQEREGYVYMIAEMPRHLQHITHVKIGYSVEPEARVGELQVGNPRQLVLLATMPAPLSKEAEIHAKLATFHVLGEWFLAVPEVLKTFGVKNNKVPT